MEASLWSCSCYFLFPAVLAASQAPVGNWVTVDDKTGAKRAVVTITESGGVLSGVIDKVYPQPGDTGICENCPGAFKGKSSGTAVYVGIKERRDNQWSGGSILDPKTGKIYRAKLTAQGNELLVRGYLGISLLGRTQVWHKE